jgi:hypothetical protein
MKLIHHLLLFVATLSFALHSKYVEGQLMNFGIVDKIKNVIHKVIPQWQSAPFQYNATTYFPMAQTSQYVVPTYIPISSEDIQQQEVSTLPQDSVNDTDQSVPDGRALIDAPLINGKCEDGYRAVSGRCRKVYGRRRRRR